MAFEHKGRKLGTPNKITRELRTALKNILSREIELLPELFDALPPRDRIELLSKLMPYALPKVESETYELSENTGFEW